MWLLIFQSWSRPNSGDGLACYLIAFLICRKSFILHDHLIFIMSKLELFCLSPDRNKKCYEGAEIKNKNSVCFCLNWVFVYESFRFYCLRVPSQSRGGLTVFEQVWLTHQCMQMCEILNRVRGQGPTYMMSRTALSRFRPILNDSGFFTIWVHS